MREKRRWEKQWRKTERSGGEKRRAGGGEREAEEMREKSTVRFKKTWKID